jgi:hypothetical protein
VLPLRPGPAQDELRIEERASYIVVVRNPDESAGPGRWRFQPLTLDLLEHEGVELVLIAASTEPEEELGVRFAPDAERATEATIFRDLALDRSRSPLQPLFTGSWR